MITTTFYLQLKNLPEIKMLSLTIHHSSMAIFSSANNSKLKESIVLYKHFVVFKLIVSHISKEYQYN